MQKVRYELDPYNRLVLTGTGEKSDLPKFRKVLDGKFKTNENNNNNNNKQFITIFKIPQFN